LTLLCKAIDLKLEIVIFLDICSAEIKTEESLKDLEISDGLSYMLFQLLHFGS